MTGRLPYSGVGQTGRISLGCLGNDPGSSSEVCSKPRFTIRTGIFIDRGCPGVNDCRICVSFALAGVCAEDMDGMDE